MCVFLTLNSSNSQKTIVSSLFYNSTLRLPIRTLKHFLCGRDENELENWGAVELKDNLFKILPYKATKRVKIQRERDNIKRPKQGESQILRILKILFFKHNAKPI